MIRYRIIVPVGLLLSLAGPTAAASFDCSEATMPVEHAICDNPALSAADEQLAKSFATATGGLTKPSVALMRADQRHWLDYAQRVCTDDAEPLTSGRYDDTGASCLRGQFVSRSRILEQSRMIEGHRFLIQTDYAAIPDPNEVDNPDSYWKVASHELVMPLLDRDDALAEPFNRYVTEMVESFGGLEDEDGSSSTSLALKVKEVAGTGRITLSVDSHWYGHGAAHGNWSIRYLHYLPEEQRGLEATDIFSGENWQDILVEAAWEQLQAQHAEWLMVETANAIAESVVNPQNWDLADDYGLIVQFQPYEVAAYAYGAPTITIAWEKLDAIKAETQDKFRYGH